MSEATIQFQGRLTRDPETNHKGNGVRFTVAVESWRSRQNNAAPAYYSVTMFGKRGGFVMDHFRKGSPIMVSGTLDPNITEGQNGQRVYLNVNADQVDFTIGESRNQGSQNYQQAPQQNYRQAPQQPQNAPQGPYQGQQGPRNGGQGNYPNQSYNAPQGQPEPNNGNQQNYPQDGFEAALNQPPF